MNKRCIQILSSGSLVILFIAGCASTKLLTPTESDVTRVKTKFPGYSLEELSKGKSLYEMHCGSCHGLKDPASQTEEQWKEVILRMSEKVNNSSKVLSDAG